MLSRRQLALAGVSAAAIAAVARLVSTGSAHATGAQKFEITKSDEEWKKLLTPEQIAQCTTFPLPGAPPVTCPANNATSYNYGFAGGGVRRRFGRAFNAFMTYQFNELSFNESYCTTSSPCNRISHQQNITFGLDWTPRPIRLD